MSLANKVENTLLARQTEAVRQMLSFNQITTAGGNVSSAPSWKVLVYDSIGQSILAPLFSVKELREMGVTLHILLHSERDPVPDVPAVYFCLPSDENLGRISRDLEANLYGKYYFNFISPISRQKLEDLASHSIQTNTVAQIEKVFDQFVQFISLEQSMFTLRHQTNFSAPNNLSFYSMSRSEMTDTEMETIMDDIVEGLFAVCVTLGTIPVIRCPKGNAAEVISKKLDRKLRENLRDTRNSLFMNDNMQSGHFSFHRPILVILDRQVDLATPLHHTWTYQALAHDVLQYSLNRVSMSETDKGTGARRKTRVCDLDSKDAFWMNHKGSPFPQVAEKIEEELEDYRSKEEDIKKMKSDMGLEGGNENDAALGLLSDNTQKLTSAVSSLPALLEKKRLIDMHTSLATAMLDQIKMRKLDLFFEIEEKIMSKQTLDKSLMQVFEDPDAGTAEDKMRLFLIYYICSAGIPDAEVDQYSNVLQEIGCDLAPLQYLKRWKSLSQMTTLPSADYSGGGTKTVSMFSKLMQQSSSFVMEGVKNLVVKKHNLPVTKIVDELMEIKQGQVNEEYQYFDPKILRGQDNIPRAKNPFQEAIVFMVGGGNYIEYQNLMDHANSKGTSSLTSGLSSSPNPMSSQANMQSKRIIYGCTTLHNANQMMQQLSKLGHEM